jgi:SAM-dependent methyltransferase
MLTATYNKSFYDETLLTSMRSANTIVPLVLQITEAQSVVDLGCGTGSWLACFHDNGVTDVCGVDNNSIENANLQIPHSKVLKHDLTKSFELNKTFDLATCLEVAEHLPAACAEQIVKNLTKLAPMVLFSAAIPHQGGTNHINEQWPEYWAEIFAKHGFVPLDCIREKIWDDDNVAYWYAQNLILYVSSGTITFKPNLEKLAAETNPKRLTLVHPKTYVKNHKITHDPRTLFMRLIWNLLPRSIRKTLIKPLASTFWKQVNTRY